MRRVPLHGGSQGPNWFDWGVLSRGVDGAQASSNAVFLVDLL